MANEPKWSKSVASYVTKCFFFFSTFSQTNKNKTTKRGGAWRSFGQMGHMLSFESPVHQDHSAGHIKPACCLNTWQYKKRQKQRERQGTMVKINKTGPVTDEYRWCQRVTDNPRNVAVATKDGWKTLKGLAGHIFQAFPTWTPFWVFVCVLGPWEKSITDTWL